MNKIKILRYLFLLVFLPIIISAQISINKDSSISIIAVGDIMLGTDFPNDRLPPQNGKFLLKNISEIISNADISIGNLEGTILDGGTPKKICKDTSICYLFRTPKRFASNLKNAGFDIFSLANNHANDFGDSGKISTESVLDSLSIGYSGRTGTYYSAKVKNKKIAFMAFAPSGGVNSINKIKSAVKSIRKLKEKNDIVIVSMHGGAEGDNAIHVKNELEMFYGEKRGNLVEFSHAVIDAGADLVIGHGPHVPRAVEIYKNKIIAYSLGNFCTYKGFRISGIRGYAPILKVELSLDGTFLNGQIISGIQSRKLGTYVDKKQKAFKFIRKLSLEDFPGSPIKFFEDGKFVIKD